MADPTIIDTADNTIGKLTQPIGKLTQLKARGIDTIIRYYSTSSWKRVTPDEARAIAEAGLKMGAVYEDAGATPSSFTVQNGKRHAQNALEQAKAVGQPPGSAIYFAVDFDASLLQINMQIIPYFEAVNDALDGKYHLGVYGSGACCDALLRQFPGIKRWITCSLGFMGSRDALRGGRFDLFQGQLSPLRGRCDEMLLGLSVDYNSPKSPSWDWGAFMPFGKTYRPPEVVHDVKWMQRKLANAANYAGAIDGDVGPLTIAAMIRYIEMRET